MLQVFAQIFVIVALKLCVCVCIAKSVRGNQQKPFDPRSHADSALNFVLIKHDLLKMILTFELTVSQVLTN